MILQDKAIVKDSIHTESFEILDGKSMYQKIQ